MMGPSKLLSPGPMFFQLDPSPAYADGVQEPAPAKTGECQPFCAGKVRGLPFRALLGRGIPAGAFAEGLSIWPWESLPERGTPYGPRKFVEAPG